MKPDTQKTTKAVREAPTASEDYPTHETAIAALQIATRDAENSLWPSALRNAEEAVAILADKAQAQARYTVELTTTRGA